MSEPTVKGIEHVSIALRDVEAGKRAYSALGFEPIWTEDLADQGLRSHVLRAGNIMIELIESLPDAERPTTVDRFLDRRGEGVHHICLEVGSLKQAMRAVEQSGLKLVDPRPSSDERGSRVFVHPSSSHGVLIGLVELHDASRQRARPGERQVFGSGEPGFEGKTFVPAVSSAGPLLFVSGITAAKPDGGVEGTDLASQAHVIFTKLRKILAEAGASFDNVVKTTDYILSREGYRAVADVRREFFGSTFPAATGVVVKELLGAGVLIEMEAVAVI